MSEPLPMVLVPGLLCTARLYAEQVPVLWRFGPVMIADHRRDDTAAAIAARILAAAPPRFALLVGLIESFSSFWASAYKEVIVFTLIIPVLLWRSLRTHHVEDDE